MRLAYYAPTWPPGSKSNGVITYLSHLVPEMRRRGHEVFIMTWDSRHRDPHTIEINKFRSLWHAALSRISPRMSLMMAMRTAAKYLVHERGVQLFEIEEAFGLSRAIPQKLAPVIVRLHGPWFLTKRYPDDARERREFAGIQSAYAVSSPTMSVLKLTQASIEIRRPASILNPISQTSDRWSITDCDRNSMLFVGRLDESKGADLLLAAFDRLAKVRPELRLTMAGPDEGIVKNGKRLSFSDFASATLSPEVRERVTLMGEVAASDLPALRLKHLLAVVPSRFEVFGYTVAEAMAMGCPVVATSTGGIPELITSGRNGLLVEPESAEALAEACETFLVDNEFAARCGAQAAVDCSEKLAPEKLGDRFELLYESAIWEHLYGYPMDQSVGGTGSFISRDRCSVSARRAH